MTSWTRWSPSSMTAWIICSSSASRMPCSPPCSMIRRSSSELIRSSAGTSARNRRLTQRVTVVSAPTSGPSSVPRTSMNRDVDSATRSACASPICFGTSSPNTIVNSVSRIVTTTSAMPSAAFASGPNWRSTSAAPSTRLTAANADARKPRKLMPIWMTARNRPGLPLRCWTRTAAPLPSSISCWIRLRRRVTRAISVAEKIPLSTTRMTMRPSSGRAPLTRDRHRQRVPTPPRPVSGVARGSGRGRRPRACRAARPSSRPHRRRSGRPRRSRAGRRSSCRPR